MRTTFLGVAVVSVLTATCSAPADSRDKYRAGDVDAAGVRTIYMHVDLGPLDAQWRDALRHILRAGELGAELKRRMAETNALMPDTDPVALREWFDVHAPGAPWNHYLHVVRRHGDGFRAIPFSEAFAADYAPIIQALRAAADTAPDTSVAQYLRAQADAHVSNVHRDAMMAWGAIRPEAPIDPFIGFGRGLRGKGGPMTFVGIPIPGYREFTNTLEKRQLEFDRGLATLTGLQAWEQKTVHPLSIERAIYYEPQDPLMEGWSMGDGEGKGATVKGVFFANLMSQWQDQVARPAVQLLLGTESAKSLDTQSAAWVIALHEFLHGIGPFTAVVGNEEVPIESLINFPGSGPLAGMIEEGKSDGLGPMIFERMVEWRVVPARSRKNYHAAWVGLLMAQARVLDDPWYRPESTFMLNRLLEGGALVRDGGHFRLQPERTLVVVREVCAELLRILRTGDRAAALRIRDSKLDPALQAIIDRLNADKVPLDIRVQFDTREQLNAL